jgi:hypothetical protein
MRLKPRLTPGESRAFSFGPDFLSFQSGLSIEPVPLFHGAPRTLRAVFNFILLIDCASFERLTIHLRQFHKESGLTLLQLRRQDATNLAPAN